MAPAVAGPGEERRRSRSLSLWWDADSPSVAPRPRPGGRSGGRRLHRRGRLHRPVDRARPGQEPIRRLRIAVLEKEVAGFGASGRNGGWCSALFATSDAALGPPLRHGGHAGDAPGHAGHGRRRRRHGARRRDRLPLRQGRHDRRRTLARFSAPGPGRGRRGPRLRLRGGRSPLARRAAKPSRWSAWRACSAPPSPRTARPSNRHCSPAAWLTRSERRGVTIYEHTEVTDIVPGEPGRPPVVRTAGGAVKADVVVRALEAWTPTLPGQKRTLVPVYSLMVATEPLGEAFWADAGLDGSGHLHRLPPHDHLRAAHRRQPHRLRRARGALPLRLRRATLLRRAPPRSTGCCARP